MIINPSPPFNFLNRVLFTSKMRTPCSLKILNMMVKALMHSSMWVKQDLQGIHEIEASDKVSEKISNEKFPSVNLERGWITRQMLMIQNWANLREKMWRSSSQKDMRHPS